MRFHTTLSFIAVAACASVAVAAPPAATNPEAAAAYKDIEATLGMVPGFFKAFPESAIAGAWEEFKALQLAPNTAIPPKYKELIGLGVSAQIPCSYCVYAHTEFAKLNGATDDEIKQVLAEAAITRHWSTWINGLQPDEAAFKAEIMKAVDVMKKMMAAPPAANAPAPAPITDAKSAFADMEKTMGMVPGFMKMMPESMVAGAWKTMKAVEMTPGPVPQKYLSMTSLAVASQIPCRYCVVADSEFAKLGGASEAERREAILMSAHTRQWSTYLNGIRYDEGKFKKEVDQLVANARKAMMKQSKTTSR
jgi:AhpD family alkylhydroperoxidase